MESTMEGSRQAPLQPNRTSGFAKFMRWFLVIIVVVFGVIFWWKYYYTYSDGYRSGLMQKLSHKGNLFKTYEGELVLSSVASTANVALASEKFYFSVPSDSIAKVLQSYEGKRAKLHYTQKNGILFWRGESQYLVDGVEADGGSQ